jgi:transposase
LNKAFSKDNAVMHLTHKPGECLTFDFAGDSLCYFDKETGEIIECSVLVCTMPFSSYCYVEALRNQTMLELISGLNNCIFYLGGVPSIVKGDNLKSWVKRPCRFEPDFNQMANDWSLHYNTNLTATRVRKPRDKASVESHVNVVYNRIYAAIRNKKAYSLRELNVFIMEELNKLNARLFQNRNTSRIEEFEKFEKPLLKPLPTSLFVPKFYAKGTVMNNYHVRLSQDKTYYSVPHKYIGQKVQIIYDNLSVEIFANNVLIASHIRTYKEGGYSTLEEHRSHKHKGYLQNILRDKEYYLNEAEKIGVYTKQVIERICGNSRFIEQSFNSCNGIIHLTKKYGNNRVERACKRSAQSVKVNYSIIKNILENNLDKCEELPEIEFNIPDHENIRGSEAYL